MESNLAVIGKGFETLLGVLVNFIYAELQKKHRKKWWELGVLQKLNEDRKKDLPTFGTDDEYKAKMDIQLCLQVITFNWREIFLQKLSKNADGLVKELIGVRNDWAHSGFEGFDNEDTARALDTMARLCLKINTTKAEEIKAIRTAFLASLQPAPTVPETVPEALAPETVTATPVAEETPAPATAATNAPEEDKDSSENPPTSSGPKLTQVLQVSPGKNLLGWREVIQPHPDVSEGRYKSAEFAADLAQVARGQGAIEYVDPDEFFARTYLTEGIKRLILTGLKRVSGQGGDPVVQLKTVFGGGKTHSQLALYHLLSGKVAIDKQPGLKQILNEVGLKEPPKAHIAVLVGTALEPAQTKKYPHLPGQTIHTLWGEIAAQLALSTGNPGLYDLVKENDLKGIAPANVVLLDLLNQAGPCLVLMDELVAYGRKIFGVKGLPAGNFDNFIVFIQALTEAVKASKNSLVVATLPESDLEIGGEGGQRTLQEIEHTFGRVEAIFKPVGAQEGFEVVRRRLFLECDNISERDQVCRKFHAMYQNHKADFPAQVDEKGYLDRLKSCYPIHPEVFDRLYDDWAASDSFQRTRGVLRLMAATIHELWVAGDNSLLIMPGSMPFDISAVKDELTRHLSDGWNSVVDHDVDGPNSNAYGLDSKTGRYGQIMAARRVSRTLMLGSAPAANVRGLQKPQILLGVIQPTEGIAIFNDVLSSLQSSQTYLYSDASGDRFWYDTRPTLRKVMEEKAKRVSTDEIESELKKRVRELPKATPFTGSQFVSCPDSSANVGDDQVAKLVVLSVNDPYNNSDAANQQNKSPALPKALEILTTCGAGIRKNQNMLLFLVPDQNAAELLKGGTKILLAWKSINEEAVSLNLDAAQVEEAKRNFSEAERTLRIQLSAAYSWLFSPKSGEEGESGAANETNEVDSAAKHEIRFERVKLDGDHKVDIIKKVLKTVKDNEYLVDSWAPEPLLLEMDKFLWVNDNHLKVSALWDYLRSYCYLSRLVNYEVLKMAIKKGVIDSAFGYAKGFEDGVYLELKLGQNLGALDPIEGYLVKKEFAEAQKTNEAQGGENNPESPDGGGTDRVPTPSVPRPPETLTPTKFVLSADLSRIKGPEELRKIADNILDLVSSPGDEGDLKITLEVTATRAKGFDHQTERSVTENCQALKIRYSNFE
ncbi:MAG: DUF499 domain-containing protein [Deltaproteobacteria bacterium]|nr:DUF499 domain-containing protein [Deltaproteobacteria bacterium]